MEKLELKHLAPYLPYGLNLYEKQRPRFRNGDYTFETEKWVGRDISRPFVKRHGVVWCKPILRPLSDLTKEIEFNGEKLVPMKWFSESEYYKRGLNQSISNWQHLKNHYFTYNLLFKWHFDVFDLHSKNLCIYYDELNK